MKRRMAAILVADVVGYSGLMEADEDGTAQRLANCRKSIDAEIAKCDGRLFKAMGDAVLVEFASPINAVRCAVGIRAGLLLAGQREERPLRMRFGLHLADVLVSCSEQCSREIPENARNTRKHWAFGTHCFRAINGPSRLPLGQSRLKLDHYLADPIAVQGSKNG
jgi:hypothetical protein